MALSNGRKVVLFGVLTALPIVAVLALGEAALRYRERHRATVPGTMPFIYYRHGRLGYALVRGVEYFGWVSTDSAGLRNGPIRPARTGAIRILADGGSTTFDSFVDSDSQTWPSRLQFWIDSLSPETPVEVLNAGVPGYRVIDNTIRLETESELYDVDLIVMLQGHNDLFAALRGATGGAATRTFVSRPSEVRRMSSIRLWLSENSLLFAKIQDRLNAISNRGRGASVVSATEVDTMALISARLSHGEAAFGRDLRFYLSAARTIGVPVVLITPPKQAAVSVWSASVPFIPPATMLHGYSIFNEAQRIIASEFGAGFVDSAPFGLDEEKWYVENDPVHFNSAGADRFARQLAEELLRSGRVSARQR